MSPWERERRAGKGGVSDFTQPAREGDIDAANCACNGSKAFWMRSRNFLSCGLLGACVLRVVNHLRNSLGDNPLLWAKRSQARVGGRHEYFGSNRQRGAQVFHRSSTMFWGRSTYEALARCFALFGSGASST